MSSATHAPPKARKRRYFFREGDDLLLLQTLLINRKSLLSSTRGHRSAAWEVVTASLNRQGILASTHSLRCRLKRLVENFQDGVVQGNQAADFTEVELLLDQYTKAQAQCEQQKTGATPRPRILQGSTLLPGANSADSESEEESTVPTVSPQQTPLPPPPESESTPTPTALVQSTPESGRKYRKRRFFFQDWHDVLLLNALLADQTISGARNPFWKDITASLTSQGLDVNAHTLRTHLRLLVDTYRKESSSWETNPTQLSEKQRLLRDYCHKLDGEDQQDQTSNDDQCFEPGSEFEDDQCRDDRAGTNHPESTTLVTESAMPPQSHAVGATPSNISPSSVTNLSQTRDVIATSTQTPKTTPISRTSSTAQTSSPPNTHEFSVQTVEVFSTPTATHVVQPSTEEETDEISGSVWKRQKLELETILHRFVAEQSERQREEREYEHARFSEQQDLQRQTIELQKRALNMQEKAMNMQDRLMSLMEKVMDKLN
ncbi:hypothetical protein ON010_g1391 [Phytophthora cinnamomi]|nr:hypothetical protein ON010_g1391 [Phytophthora cinnamomi]